MKLNTISDLKILIEKLFKIDLNNYDFEVNKNLSIYSQFLF